jgi:class 3 adenylate cyclase/predicted ATPase
MAKLELARASGEMVGERRVVTMLFCDVKGSTAAAEQLDPEEWTEIINGAFEHMIKPIYKYEGTVARLMGDGILAFFGAPIAHEDDPQRAVLAGLDIVASIDPYRKETKRQWGVDINVRVGINTGMVVVGAVGSDLRMEYTAMGDAINLAARMEQTAVPGSVQIAEETHKLVAPLFEFEDIGGIEVKGKAAPIPAYRVLGRKAAPGRLRGIEGLEINLIGRKQELASLERTIADVQQGVGRIVFVIGEAGFGKSRLIQEAKQLGAKSITGNGNLAPPAPNHTTPVWYETTSLSYETALPYGIFRRLIRRVNGITHNDPPAAVREKLAPLAEIFPTEQQAKVMPVFEALFDLGSLDGKPPLEGEAFKQALFELMPALWQHRFAGQPTVILFDDIHWSDRASVALLQHLLPLVEEMPLVLLCVFRPDRRAPAWQVKTIADETYHHRYSEISLRPFSDDESNQMIDELLRNPELPASLRARILERANGNPFFIEEVIRTLIDNGALIPEDSRNGHPRWRVSDRSADIHIPDNLQSLLTARIDNLSEDERQTLQMAAVIGRNFYRRVLVLINETSVELDSHLNSLLRQEMIRESARIPEVEYSFRNPLTQEAAYRTILLKRRREFHQKVAEAIEALFPERSVELGPQLAYHYGEGQCFNRALPYYQQIGDTAFRLFANAEAATQYGHALDMARQSSEPVSTDTMLYLFNRRGRALEHQVEYDAAVANYEAMISLAGERDEPSLTLAGMMALATIYSTMTPIYDNAKAQLLSEESLILARELGDRAAEAKINWNLMNSVVTSGGDLEKGLVYGEASLQIARELNLREQIGYTLTGMTMIYMNNDHLKEARELLDEVDAVWRELDDQPMLVDSYAMASFVNITAGDFAAAIEILTELEQTSKAINNTWNLIGSKFYLGMCYLELGEISRSKAHLEEGIPLVEQAGMIDYLFYVNMFLSQLYTTLGLFDQARSLADEVFNRRDEGLLLYRPVILGLVCETYVLSGALSQARAVADLLAELDTSNNGLWRNSYAIKAQAELALAENRPHDVIAAVEPFISRLKEFGVRSALPHILHLLGRAYIALDRPEEAFAVLEEALHESKVTGERRWRWQILAALADLAEEEPAAKWRAEALETIYFIADNIGPLELRQYFLHRTDVAALIEVTGERG